MTEPGNPAPSFPSRREQDLESALDEEESSDLDPLDAPSQAIFGRIPDWPRLEVMASHAPPTSSTRRDRPFLLRC